MPCLFSNWHGFREDGLLGTGSLNFEELINVIPLHLLLTYLVHQIELPQVPSLPESLGLSKAQYLEAEALPLWEEKPQALENLKVNVRNLIDSWLLLSKGFFHVFPVCSLCGSLILLSCKRHWVRFVVFLDPHS